MVYQDKWLTLDEAPVLSRGFHKGYEYFVVSYGIYPCAYIALREGQPFYKFSGMFKEGIFLNSAKRWTTEEIVEECKQVIEQLYLREHPELYYK